MAKYRTEIQETTARFITEEIRIGSIFVLFFIPPFSLLGLLLLVASSTHIVVVLSSFVCGGILFTPLMLWAAALVKVTTVLQADAEGILYSRESPLVPRNFAPFVPKLGEKRVPYEAVKECKVTTTTTRYRHSNRHNSTRHHTNANRTVTSYSFRFCLHGTMASPNISIYLGSGQKPKHPEPGEFATAFHRLKARYA